RRGRRGRQRGLRHQRRSQRAILLWDHASQHAADAGEDLACDPGCQGKGRVTMRSAIIDDLRAAFDATTVFTGNEIDARYHTDMAGIPPDPPLPAGRAPTTEGVLTLLQLCNQGPGSVATPGRVARAVRGPHPSPRDVLPST